MRLKRLAKRGLQRFRQSTTLKNGYWRARRILGLCARHNAEILYWLRRRPALRNGSQRRIFNFRWGEFEYVDAGQLRAQFEEIFIERQYAFSSDRPDPVIIDCGGNVGLSAIWFKLNYPECRLTVYEADPDLAKISEANLKRAGFEDVSIRHEAVWIAGETVAFSKTGNDSGRIVSESSTFCPALDLSEYLPSRVDLLKIDIEGAEFQVLDRLCATQAIQRVQKLICEFHVSRDKTDDLLATLARIRGNGMQISMTAAAVPWIGLAINEAPFEAIQRNQVLMEVFAWR